MGLPLLKQKRLDFERLYKFFAGQLSMLDSCLFSYFDDENNLLVSINTKGKRDYKSGSVQNGRT